MARITGIAFPFRRAGGQFPAVVEDGDAVDASVRQIIETSRYERPMRPGSGSGVWSMLFENNDALLVAKLRREIRRAIREQEQRVDVLQVNVTIVNVDEIIGNAVEVDVIYKLAGRLRSTSTTLEGGDTG